MNSKIKATINKQVSKQKSRREHEHYDEPQCTRSQNTVLLHDVCHTAWQWNTVSCLGRKRTTFVAFHVDDGHMPICCASQFSWWCLQSMASFGFSLQRMSSVKMSYCLEWNRLLETF